MKKREVEIGTVGVDSGTLLLIDPCYLKYIKELREGDFEEGWQKFCKNTLFPMHNYEISADTIADGVVFTTAYGDGGFPVVATVDDENRILKIEVKFT